MTFALGFARQPMFDGEAPDHAYDAERQLNVLPSGEPLVGSLDRAMLFLLTNCQNPANGQTVYNDD